VAGYELVGTTDNDCVYAFDGFVPLTAWCSNGLIVSSLSILDH